MELVKVAAPVIDDALVTQARETLESAAEILGDLGTYVKALRVAAGRTQRDLAYTLKMKPNAIERIETGGNIKIDEGIAILTWMSRGAAVVVAPPASSGSDTPSDEPETDDDETGSDPEPADD